MNKKLLNSLLLGVVLLSSVGNVSAILNFLLEKFVAKNGLPEPYGSTLRLKEACMSAGGEVDKLFAAHEQFKASLMQGALRSNDQVQKAVLLLQKVLGVLKKLKVCDQNEETPNASDYSNSLQGLVDLERDIMLMLQYRFFPYFNGVNVFKEVLCNVLADYSPTDGHSVSVDAGDVFARNRRAGEIRDLEACLRSCVEEYKALIEKLVN